MLKLKNIIEYPKMNTEISRLYKKSFPKDEQVPMFFLKLKAKKEIADFYGIYDNQLFIGFLYVTYYQDIVFVFYIAIAPDLQGKGYGSAILKEVKQLHKGKRIILNIETVDKNSDNHKEREKRKQFYLKNGFKEAGFKTQEKNIIYEMLCYGDNVSFIEYTKLVQKYMGKLIYKIYYKSTPL